MSASVEITQHVVWVAVPLALFAIGVGAKVRLEIALWTITGFTQSGDEITGFYTQKKNDFVTITNICDTDNEALFLKSQLLCSNNNYFCHLYHCLANITNSLVTVTK